MGHTLAPYCRRPEWEPSRRIPAFDHRRQFYVAFSRPRDLLVLTASESVHPRFDGIWDAAPRWSELDDASLAALARQRFQATGGEAGAEEVPTPSRRVIPHLKRLDIEMGLAGSQPIALALAVDRGDLSRGRSSLNNNITRQHPKEV